MVQPIQNSRPQLGTPRRWRSRADVADRLVVRLVAVAVDRAVTVVHRRQRQLGVAILACTKKRGVTIPAKRQNACRNYHGTYT